MITIDNDLRTINIPSDTKLLGVVGDKDVNRLEIEMPAYYKDIDLSSYAVKINFRNVERGGLRHIEGEYIPVDKVSTGEVINFSWLVGEDACKYVGITEFSICLSDSETKEFNTRWDLSIYQLFYPLFLLLSFYDKCLKIQLRGRKTGRQLIR